MPIRAQRYQGGRVSWNVPSQRSMIAVGIAGVGVELDSWKSSKRAVGVECSVQFLRNKCKVATWSTQVTQSHYHNIKVVNKNCVDKDIAFNKCQASTNNGKLVALVIIGLITRACKLSRVNYVLWWLLMKCQTTHHVMACTFGSIHITCR